MEKGALDNDVALLEEIKTEEHSSLHNISYQTLSITGWQAFFYQILLPCAITPVDLIITLPGQLGHVEFK